MCHDVTQEVKAGAHNNVESGRKGRSVKQPRKIIKFEPHAVVPLLFLACTCIVVFP